MGEHPHRRRTARGPAGLHFLNGALAPRDYSFGQLLARASGIASKLSRLGLPPKALVGILIDSQELQILHYLAALAGGLTPAILTPPNRKWNRAYYLETTRAVGRYCAFAAVITDLDDLDLSAPQLAPGTLEVRRQQTGPLSATNTAALAKGFALDIPSGYGSQESGARSQNGATRTKFSL